MSGVGDKSFFSEHNRRRNSRRTTRQRAWADPGGTAPVVDCLIVDASDGGAGVAAVAGGELPDTFHLQIEAARPVGDAEVVWRSGTSVGVKIAKPAPKER